MLHLNLTASKLIGNYASLKDSTENFISSNTFEADFQLQRLGILDNGNFKNAVKYFKTSIEINPNNAEVYRLLGKIYLYKEREILKIHDLLKQNDKSENELKHFYFVFAGEELSIVQQYPPQLLQNHMSFYYSSYLLIIVEVRGVEPRSF